MRGSATVWLLVGALTACGAPPAEVDRPTATTGNEIVWFDGSMDEAFALAEREGKPLFLFWGAVWCPYCSSLKTKILQQPEFVSKSRELICVHLDGDGERAQSWGEKLGTAGFPTVMLFDPAGQELLRMSNDIPVEAYNRVLETALSRPRPVAEIVAAVRTGDPDPQDLHLLAFHSWDQDRSVEAEPGDRLALFRDLHRLTPRDLPVERSRFLALLLGAAEASGEEENGSLIDDDQRSRLRAELAELLADPDLRAVNVSFLVYGVDSTVELLEPEEGPGRTELVAAWEEAAAAIEDDQELAISERLGGLRARLTLARLGLGEDASLPDELVTRVKERVDWASGQAMNEVELHTVLSSMTGLLTRADLVAEAESLMTARMEETEAPYYFMSWLGTLAEKREAPEEALAWRRRAWEAAEGPYTRFLWGSGHVRKQIELAPDEHGTIEKDSLALLDELLGQPDAFAHRNFASLERLETSYREWEGGEEVVARIRDHVLGRCASFDDAGEDSLRSRCMAFLGPEEDDEGEG